METHSESLSFSSKVVTPARRQYDAAWFPCIQRNAVNSAKEIRSRRRRTREFVSGIQNGADAY